MNRKERRALGQRGPMYVQRIGDSRPRYVRRHITEVMLAIRSGVRMNRRLRKMHARIERHAIRIGLAR